MAMSNRAIRKQIKKLGGKPTVANVERAAHSVNTTDAEKRARREQARENGVLDVPIDPRSVNDPREWYKGKPLNTRPAEIQAMIDARRRASGR